MESIPPEPPLELPRLTETQRRVRKCVECLLGRQLAGDESAAVKNETIVDCLGMSRTSSYACLEKFTREDMLSKEPGTPTGLRRGASAVLYTPTPKGHRFF